MLIQTFESLLFRDLLVILRFFAVFTIFYMTIQSGKRIKDAKFLSATTGFTIFLLMFGLFSIIAALPDMYPGIFNMNLIYHARTWVFAIGMITFIFMVEIDEKLHGVSKKNKKFSFYLTVTSLIGIIFLSTITFDQQFGVAIVFIYLLIPFNIAVRIFIKKFNALEMVKQSNPTIWFYVGLFLAGLSNFLYIPIIHLYLGYLVSIITSFCIVIGLFLMKHSWFKLPILSELDWMLKMERLMVIHLISSGLLFQYNFQIIGESEKEKLIEGDLAGSAIGGMNMLLREILASDGNIKEIEHSNKKILFSSGAATACILITTGKSNEFRYRLEMFHLSFEKLFSEEKLKNWTGDVREFRKANDLIKKHFA